MGVDDKVSDTEVTASVGVPVLNSFDRPVFASWVDQVKGYKVHTLKYGDKSIVTEDITTPADMNQRIQNPNLDSQSLERVVAFIKRGKDDESNLVLGFTTDRVIFSGGYQVYKDPLNPNLGFQTCLSTVPKDLVSPENTPVEDKLKIFNRYIQSLVDYFKTY